MSSLSDLAWLRRFRGSVSLVSRSMGEAKTDVAAERMTRLLKSMLDTLFGEWCACEEAEAEFEM